MTGPPLQAATTAVVALLVGAVGASLPGSIGRAVWSGVALGYLAQLVAFRVFLVWLVPGHGILGHGLGMVWRVMVVGITATLLLRSDTATAASVLFALVAFFFVSTVLEPLFLRTEPLKRR